MPILKISGIKMPKIKISYLIKLNFPTQFLFKIFHLVRKIYLYFLRILNLNTYSTKESNIFNI